MGVDTKDDDTENIEIGMAAGDREVAANCDSDYDDGLAVAAAVVVAEVIVAAVVAVGVVQLLSSPPVPMSVQSVWRGGSFRGGPSRLDESSFAHSIRALHHTAGTAPIRSRNVAMPPHMRPRNIGTGRDYIR